MKRLIHITLLASASLLIIGCGDARDPVGSGVTQEIGPSGGTLELGAGLGTLQVPTGALDKTVEIRVTPLDDSELPAGGVSGTAVEIGPAGLSFKKPVKLTLAYDQANLSGKDITWLRTVQVLVGKKIGPTLLSAHDAQAATLASMVVQAGKYSLADLKTASAVMTHTKKKITEVDVLFVVDNSNSMIHEQKNLAANFPKFITKLEQAKLNYRVGVISTDLGAGSYNLPSCETPGGDGGKLQNKAQLAGCTPPKDSWIARHNGVTNVPGGDVSSAFSCIAQLGAGGCGFEQPLEASRWALDPAINANPGFLRKASALALVYITDEDDCSAKGASLFNPSQQGLSDPLGPLSSFRCFEFGVTCTCPGQAACDRKTIGPRTNCVPSKSKLMNGVSDYVGFLKKLRPGGEIIVSAITGPADKVEVGLSGSNPTLKPSCQTAAGMAVPAVRLSSLVKSFGKRGSLTSICSSDFSPALSKLGDLVATQTHLSWCLPYDPADTNPLTQEREADCVVIGSKAGKLAACKPGSKTPCYGLAESKTCGKSSTVMNISNITPAALGDEVYAVCLVMP